MVGSSPFTHTSELGSLSDGVFLNSDRADLALQTDQNDNKKMQGGSTKGSCQGQGFSRVKEVPDHLYTYGPQCASWTKGFKKKRMYRYMTRKPNSERIGLYIEGDQVRTKWAEGDKIIAGQPCPLASSAKWTSDQKAYEDKNGELKLECTYKDIDDTMLRAMTDAMKVNERNGPRFKTWNAVANHYCSDPANAYKIISNTDVTCKQLFSNKNLAMEYCKAGNNIAKQPTLCSPDNIGDTAMYDSLAKKFCDANPTDSWCGCYNIINQVCKRNPDANGCSSVQALYDKMELQGMSTEVFRLKGQCTAPVCKKTRGEVWKPASDPSIMKCDMKFNICNQAIEQGVAEGSPVTANCEFNDTQVTEAAASGSRDPAKLKALSANSGDIATAEAVAKAAKASDDGTPGDSVKDGKKKNNTIIFAIITICLLMMSVGAFVALS
tara:strand:+ start:1238 stop:2548 length:1311 start_codon:yes stop_codon:yes gene_type:complete